MEGGPPRFTPDYSGRALLRNSTTQGSWHWPTGLSPSVAPRSRGLRLASPYACVGPTTPQPQGPRFGLYPFRSPLLGASRLISLSSGYLDVSVPQVRSPFGVTAIAGSRVSPFGHLGINACVPLPRAYRSLPRPSSPSCAQASPTCFRSLDHNIRQAEHARSTTSDSSFVRLRRRYAPPPPAKTQSLVLIRFPTFTSPFHCQTAWSCASAPLPEPSPGQLRVSMVRSRVHETCDDQKRFRIGRRNRLPRPTRCSVKEVIQPQVPLRLPCYDFAPVTALALGGLVPCGFRHRLRALTASMA